MLVLQRKAGQSIVIEGGVVLHVVQVRGSSVRLGIDAPESIGILRGELQPRPVEAQTAGEDNERAA